VSDSRGRCGAPIRFLVVWRGRTPRLIPDKTGRTAAADLLYSRAPWMARSAFTVRAHGRARTIRIERADGFVCLCLLFLPINEIEGTRDVSRRTGPPFLFGAVYDLFFQFRGSSERIVERIGECSGVLRSPSPDKICFRSASRGSPRRARDSASRAAPSRRARRARPPPCTGTQHCARPLHHGAMDGAETDRKGAQDARPRSGRAMDGAVCSDCKRATNGACPVVWYREGESRVCGECGVSFSRACVQHVTSM